MLQIANRRQEFKHEVEPLPFSMFTFTFLNSSERNITFRINTVTINTLQPLPPTLPEETDSWQDSARSFISSKTSRLNEKQRRPFVSSAVRLPCRACFSALLINQDMFHICLILSPPTIPVGFCIFAAVMTSTCPPLMLIAPHFGLCARDVKLEVGRNFHSVCADQSRDSCRFSGCGLKIIGKSTSGKRSTFSFFVLDVLGHGISSFSFVFVRGTSRGD